ncbi:DNA-formamidopyrimidine glycosylase family protein [Ferruginibacter albus]|uniref:DNA-formamidopyrimidine glycosylase family protein n=1 Tax=Ferruginibacter albus TaxID=2875540 RepID=UPI001CC3783F|nr:DNA-formamidopyrimidine glycosylase family protein [Ferruginibacter albus]UAY53333.1 endonuclease [Ferruginibacter albus]
MPEGPSILLLKEATKQFVGKKVLTVSGNSKMDLSFIKNKTIIDIKTWGKQYLICFKNVTIRIHLLMFGSYTINTSKEFKPRLHLQFKNGELNFYNCSIKIIEEELDEVYDWNADVMSDLWDSKKAEKKLLSTENTMVCDALLDQNIFSGVGNIIKNEVLFRIKVHPESIVTKLPVKKLREMIKEAVKYSFEFLEWKRKYVLREHWLAHSKKICPRDNISFSKGYLGKTHRRSFYCNKCQVLYK